MSSTFHLHSLSSTQNLAVESGDYLATISCSGLSVPVTREEAAPLLAHLNAMRVDELKSDGVLPSRSSVASHCARALLSQL